MCKESIQLEIIKKSEILKKSARLLSFYRNPDEKHFFYLALKTNIPDLKNSTLKHQFI